MTDRARIFPQFPLAGFFVQAAMFLAAAGTAVESARAATVISSASLNVSTSGTQFLIPKFDPTLGTLTAVDLTVYSSTVSGSFTLTRTTGSRTFTNFTAALALDPLTGFAGYQSADYSFSRSPSGSVTINASTPTQTVTVSPTAQSLLASGPETLPISGPYASYVGPGNVAIDAFLLFGDTNTGSGNFATQNFLLADTTLQLRYTYTPSVGPVEVPEMDPSGLGGAAAFMTSLLALAERRRLRSGRPTRPSAA